MKLSLKLLFQKRDRPKHLIPKLPQPQSLPMRKRI